MTSTIMVSEYIKSGFSPEDANKMVPIIDNALKELADGEMIMLDFTDVKFFTTLFFNLTLGRLLNQMSIDEYDKKIKLINLSDVGNVAYQHSLDNAKRKNAIGSEEKDARTRILEELMQE